MLNKIVFIFNVSFSRFLKSLMTSEKDQIQDGTNKGIRNIPVRFFVMTREKFKGVFFFFFSLTLNMFDFLSGYFLTDISLIYTKIIYLKNFFILY